MFFVTIFLLSFPQSLTDCINDSHVVPHPSTHSCIHDAAGMAFCLPGFSRTLRDCSRTPVPLEEVGALYAYACAFEGNFFYFRKNYYCYKEILRHLSWKDSCISFKHQQWAVSHTIHSAPFSLNRKQMTQNATSYISFQRALVKQQHIVEYTILYFLMQWA